MLGPLGWLGGSHVIEMYVCEWGIGIGGFCLDGMEGLIVTAVESLSVQPPSAAATGQKDHKLYHLKATLVCVGVD